MTARLLGIVCVASALLGLAAPAEASPGSADHEAGSADHKPRSAGAKPGSVHKTRSAEHKARRDDPARLAERARVLEPLEAAATACFAETIDANPTALGHARAGRWYEAASVGGYLCRPEVAKLMRAHDVFDGTGAGARYFRGAYVQHLGAALATTLEPVITRHTVAEALPPADAVKASLTIEAAPGQALAR